MSRSYGDVMELLPLEGFVVGVTADRRQQEQVTLLERRGAQVLPGPSIRTLPLGPEGRVEAATEQLRIDPPDVVVANTGIGVRGWLASAASWGREDALLGLLRGARLAARGPKAAGALTTAGLTVWYQEPSETMDGVIRHLVACGVAGATVALIKDGGDDPSHAARLEAAGATVVSVPVYRWTVPEDERPVWRLIDAACDNRLDAVTFTAAPAIRNLMAIAAERGAADLLLQALNGRVAVACQGPVCAEAAAAVGIEDPLVPHRARLGALVQQLTTHLEATRRVLFVGGVRIVVQGRTLLIDEEQVRLSDREHAVFRALMHRPGAVVPKALLLRIWGTAGADSHVVDAAVSRLRQRLGPAAGAVVSFPSRWYRLDAEESRVS